MQRITPVHWKTLECIFIKDGFVFKKQKGSHKSYVKPGCQRPIIIPKYTAIDIDIIKSNMKTAKMSRKRYFDLLSQC